MRKMLIKQARSAKVTIELQKEQMQRLYELLPELEKTEPLPYIKANTVVNKAASNVFGHEKMLQKADMSEDMIQVRDQVLQDTTKLYEVLQDFSLVKNALYAKWQNKRLQKS